MSVFCSCHWIGHYSPAAQIITLYVPLSGTMAHVLMTHQSYITQAHARAHAHSRTLARTRICSHMHTSIYIRVCIHFSLSAEYGIRTVLTRAVQHKHSLTYHNRHECARTNNTYLYYMLNCSDTDMHLLYVHFFLL